MKKIKNKFILGVILIIVLIVFSQVFIAFSNNAVDTNSYVTLIKGSASLNEIQIEKDIKQKVKSGDKIHVIGGESLAVIEWGDGSLTRLGANTKISIEQNEISRDYTKINISFELLAGKTWSNVVSFIGKDSSFTQTFDGMEAGVRGTIFDVDLEKDYINVTDHQVVLTSTQGEEFIIKEDAPLQLSTLSLISFQDFIEYFQDVSWADLNHTYDAEYFKKLTSILQESIRSSNPFLFILDWISPKYRILYELDTAKDYSTIEKLTSKVKENEKGKVYEAVLSRYQDFNFIQANDYEFYKRKIFYKKVLIFFGENDFEKEQLVKSAAYDFDSIITSGSNIGIEETMSFLSENKDILSDVDFSIIQSTLNKIPLEKLEEFKNDFKNISSLFPQELDLSRFGDIDSLKKNAEGRVIDFMNDTQSIIDLIRNK